MKTIIILSLLCASMNSYAEYSCKNLQTCTDWVSNKTGVKYDLQKLDKRTLKLEKDFNFNEGDPDFIYNYILQSNDLVRIKRENGFQVIVMRELKEFQFPNVNIAEIPNNLDFYSAEFPLSNKEKVRNALLIIKKFISKNGRVLEVANTPQVQVIDTGINLNAIKLIVNELNK